MGDCSEDVGVGCSGGTGNLSKSCFIAAGIAMGGIKSIALAGVEAAAAEAAWRVLPCFEAGGA